MADIRILPNDPAYELELARRQHAADKFIAKVFFIFFIIATTIAFMAHYTFFLLIAVLCIIIALYKFIHAAYIKSTFRL